MRGLEFYLEEYDPSNGDEPKVTTLIEWAPGAGHYIINGGSLDIKDRQITGDLITRVTLDLMKSPFSASCGRENDIRVIDLDETGVGRLHIPPNKWLVVKNAPEYLTK